MSEHDGKFDPIAAEFVDVRLQPPDSEALNDVERRVQELYRFSHRHPVVEAAFIVDDSRVIIKKHLEASWVDEFSDYEHEWPYGEITFYDKSRHHSPTTYRISLEGSILRTPGFSEGYPWYMDEDGELYIDKDDWPRTLESEEVDELAEQVFNMLGAPVPDEHQGPLITYAIDTAVSKGVHAHEMSEILYLVGDPASRKISNDTILVHAVEREAVQPGIEFAPKIRLDLLLEPERRDLREATVLTIFEDSLAHYEIKYIDFANIDRRRTDGSGVEQFNNRVKEWNRNHTGKELGHAVGMQFATQEHLERVQALLEMITPRIKWESVPNASGN